MIQEWIPILNFLQGIAWPVVAFIVFCYFAPIVKEVLLSMKKTILDQGLKISNPSIGEVELPGEKDKKKRKKKTTNISL